MGKPSTVIRAEALKKRFGQTEALAGLSLSVEEGTILGVLGPNGAGKTTTVRILATLLRPDAGRAEVCGFDVVRQADQVRARIGLSGQYAAVDDQLTGRENLEMFGRLYHLGAGAARRRAAELLEGLDLVEAASRPVKGYSGGMRRRLDLAASLVAAPPVLFLDEPTTGLDPRSRLALWDVIRDRVASGTSVLLTTQYLEEADRLAHQIVVIDRGRVIASGTADELKARVGGEHLELTVARDGGFEAARRIVRSFGSADPYVEQDRRYLRARVPAGAELLPGLVQALQSEGVRIEDLGIRRPTLDDVFLALTGAGAAGGENQMEIGGG